MFSYNCLQFYCTIEGYVQNEVPLVDASNSYDTGATIST